MSVRPGRIAKRHETKSDGTMLRECLLLKYGLYSVRPALPESRSFQMVLEAPRCFQMFLDVSKCVQKFLEVSRCF
eukprot:jgi/Chrzof1/5571/Cz16g07280.t1